MVCNACGHEIGKEAEACANCGAKVAETTLSAEEELTAEELSSGEASTDQAAPASYETTKLGADDAAETEEPAAEQQTVASVPRETTPVSRAPKRSGAGRGMILAVLIVGAIIIGGVWAYLKFSGPAPVKLTARDMEILVNEALDPSQRQMISSSDEQRKELSKQVKQILALAYEAEKRGLGDRPQVESEIKIRTDQALGMAYRKKNPGVQVSDAEVTTYLQAHPKEFDEFLEENPQFKKMAAQADEQIKREFGKIRLMAERARNDGLDKEEGTKLMLLLQRSQALAGAYLIELQKPEIEQYYNEHKAELNQVRARHILIKSDPQDLGETPGGREEARKKAQTILERVRKGEDFASLAREHSDDEVSKTDGGDLGFFGRGSMVPQFEQAVFGLAPGEVSDLVETQYGFHIIKVEEQREPSLDDPEFQDQIVMKLDRAGLEKKIDEIAAASQVEVAEDFKVEAPPAAPALPQGQDRPF
jgi:parvulin-like peptidyl-prolyl isomerase